MRRPKNMGKTRTLSNSKRSENTLFRGSIYTVMDVSEKTLDHCVKIKYKGTFEEAQDRFRAYEKASLIRTQFKIAENNPSMVIRHGKQYRGSAEPVRKTTARRRRQRTIKAQSVSNT